MSHDIFVCTYIDRPLIVTIFQFVQKIPGYFKTYASWKSFETVSSSWVYVLEYIFSNGAQFYLLCHLIIFIYSKNETAFSVFVEFKSKI